MMMITSTCLYHLFWPTMYTLPGFVCCSGEIWSYRQLFRGSGPCWDSWEYRRWHSRFWRRYPTVTWCV